MEEFFRMLVASVDAGHVYLFPFYGHIVGFEDGLDGFRHFGANTVTWTGFRYQIREAGRTVEEL